MYGHVRQDPHGRFRLIGVDELLSTCRTPCRELSRQRRGEFRELKIAGRGRHRVTPLREFIVHGEIQLQECASSRSSETLLALDTRNRDFSLESANRSRKWHQMLVE
jgi:hypothetical protein